MYTIDKAYDCVADLTKPLMQWDRLRNPKAIWAGIALGVLFPFVVWTHDWLMIVLVTVAVFSYQYWFPPYIEAGDDESYMTRLMDASQKWMEDTSRQTKTLIFVPYMGLVAPMIWALWINSILWSLYFVGFIVAYKTLFGYIMMHPESQKKKKTATKKKSTAKKKTTKKKTVKEAKA